MDLFQFIAARLRELRNSYNHDEGLSQEKLAAKLNIAANTVSRWETATYRPSVDDLEKLARFFGVSISTFFPPEDASKIANDDKISALLRTAKQLDAQDLDELRSYAEFRRARSLYEQKKRPKAGRPRKGAI